VFKKEKHAKKLLIAERIGGRLTKDNDPTNSGVSNYLRGIRLERGGGGSGKK